MITKLATFRGVTSRGDPLVRVFRQGESVTKVAGTLMQPIQDWLGTYKSDSSKIAILVNALGASEFWGQNVNGDIFPESALIHDCRCHPGEQHPIDDFTGKVVPPYGYWTFLNAFPYVHHRNKDPTRAFGKVVVTCWNPTMKRVELIVLIDRHLAMQHGAQHIVDRIDRGEYPDVSMGCRVPYDICTVCGNKSKTRNDYCSCVKNIGMGKILDDGRRIGVINTYPRFFDISFVFIGADKTAKMMCKLGSVWVPRSVAEAEEAYSFEEDVNGLIKAACGRDSCTECRGKCKMAEPRIEGVPLQESDRILSGKLKRKVTPEEETSPITAGARSVLPPLLAAQPALGRAARGAAFTLGLRELKEKMSASETQFTSEVYSSGTHEPTRHKRMSGDFKDGKGEVTLEKLAPPPPSSQTLFGRADPQDEEGQRGGALITNEDTPTDGVDDDTKLSSAFPLKIGPPPSPNRDKYPFVGSMNFRGLLIYVENAPGTWRTGKGWQTKMKAPYGEFAKTSGTDGDKLDVYVGPHKDCENVYIVHQNHVYGPKKGEYDEDKVMLGFRTPAQAKAMYLAHYDSPKFFRSMTTMAFPLFKRAIMRGEVDGEKVAMEKIAESLKLEDLFDSATTEGTRRRERTWRDKTTGKETNATGSGMGSWEKTKTASERIYGPMDLYKLSMEDKEAAKRKWAEIVKQVGPSKAVGQTSPLLSASEPCIPTEALDAMGAKGLESALATPSLMGMVLKPREFQRIVLVGSGKSDLANKLDDAGACFRPQLGESGPCSCLEPQHADMDVLRMLLPLLSQRSYFGPVVKRRILRITISKPEVEAPVEKEVDSPLLSKIGSAYNWYRREQVKLAASAEGTVASIPELHAGIYGLTDVDLFKTAGFPDKATTGMMIGAIPLTLMYSAHLRSERERGRNLGALSSFVANHPWISTVAAVSGTRALMSTPATREKIDEAGRRAGKAIDAARGK